MRIVQWSIAWRNWLGRSNCGVDEASLEAMRQARAELLESRDNLVSAYLDADKPQEAWAALKAMQFLIERYGR